MIEWPTNEVKNESSHIILCAFSSGGTVFDAGKWTVKMLMPGRMVDNKDIDYIGPYRIDLAINGRPGWWKMFQGAPYTVSDTPVGQGLKLSGFWPRKSFSGKSEDDYIKEWRSIMDEKDRNFGKKLPDPEDLEGYQPD